MTSTALFTFEDYLRVAAEEDARLVGEQEHYKAERAAERFREWEQARDLALEVLPELRGFMPRLPSSSEEQDYAYKRPSVVWEGESPDQERIQFGTRRSGSALEFYLRDYPYTAWEPFNCSLGGYLYQDTPEDARVTFLALLVRASWRLEREEIARLEQVAEAERIKAERAPTIHYHEWRARLARYCYSCQATELEPTALDGREYDE